MSATAIAGHAGKRDAGVTGFGDSRILAIMISTRITTALSLALLLAACGDASDEAPSCTASATYGQVSICLPTLDGYTEAYGEPAVSARANEAELPTNEVLAFYLTDEQHARVESLGDQQIDDYVKVFATRDLADETLGTGDLADIREQVLRLYGGEVSEEMQARMDAVDIDERRLGQPRLLEEYRLTDDSFTLVIAVRYRQPDGSTQEVLETLNGVLTRGRYVNVGVYRTVDGEVDTAALKAKNDAVLRAFLAANA